jgi:hypothetical protein
VAAEVLPKILDRIQFRAVSMQLYYGNVLGFAKVLGLMKAGLIPKQYGVHSGKYCFGKTPMQTFRDSIPLVKEKMLNENL